MRPRRSGRAASRLVWGLDRARVGDVIGAGRADRRAQDARAARQFSPPTLETVVRPVDPAKRGALFAALADLAEQDPFIALRRDDDRHEIRVSLYGEVQKEVIARMLARRLRHRRELRADVTAVRRVRSWHRGRVRDHRHRQQSVPGHRGSAGRTRSARIGRRVPPRRGVGLHALRVHACGRGYGLQLDEPGPTRLAGARRDGHTDAFRLLSPAEPHARHLRQEHVEHGRRFPCAHAAGPDDGTAPGRHRGVRTGAPVRASASGRDVSPSALPVLTHLRAVPSRTEAHGRYYWVRGHHSGRVRPRPATASARTHRRRRRFLLRLRPLRTGVGALAGTAVRRSRSA